MMSGNGANPVFFNEKKKKKRLDVQNSLPPTPLRLITSNFHLTPTLSLSKWTSYVYRSFYLTHFMPLVSFLYLLKYQKMRGLLMFSEGITVQWHEIG